MKAGGEADRGGDTAFGDITDEKNGGSGEPEEGEESGGDEGEVGGVASLADALVDNATFDVVV